MDRGYQCAVAEDIFNRNKIWGMEQAFEPIIWDGNTEGLPVYSITQGDTVMNFYRVADYIPMIDTSKIRSFVLCGVTNDGTVNKEEITSDESNFDSNFTFMDHGYMGAQGLMMASDGEFTVGGYIEPAVPEGIWFVSAETGEMTMYYSELNPAVVHIPIPEEYIPVYKPIIGVVESKKVQGHYVYTFLEEQGASFKEINSAILEGSSNVYIKYRDGLNSLGLMQYQYSIDGTDPSGATCRVAVFAGILGGTISDATTSDSIYIQKLCLYLDGSLAGYCDSVAYFSPNKVPFTDDANIFDGKQTFAAGVMIYNGIIVSSSTSGSSKKFKITVDDTGAIDATEVTE